MIDSTPPVGTIECPAARMSVAFNAAGARPDPFKAIISSDPAGLSKIKQSPPIPVICGSNNPCNTAAAIAASTAFPPASSI